MHIVLYKQDARGAVAPSMPSVMLGTRGERATTFRKKDNFSYSGTSSYNTIQHNTTMTANANEMSTSCRQEGNKVGTTVSYKKKTETFLSRKWLSKPLARQTKEEEETKQNGQVHTIFSVDEMGLEQLTPRSEKAAAALASKTKSGPTACFCLLRLRSEIATAFHRTSHGHGNQHVAPFGQRNPRQESLSHKRKFTGLHSKVVGLIDSGLTGVHGKHLTIV